MSIDRRGRRWTRSVGAVKIRINGDEYDSWDEVPEETRRLLAQVIPDDDHNGVPDVFEEGREPGHHTYRRRFTVTTRSRDTLVPRSGARPGFRFRTTDAFARALPPEPGDLEVDRPASVAPSEAPIVLNGVEVGADGKPLRKKRWWNRG
jgi:hypothetical protein